MKVKYSHKDVQIDYESCLEIMKENQITNLSKIIDSTLLKQDMTMSQVQILCKEALNYKFKSVCVPSCYLDIAASIINNNEVKICTVASFPLGYMDTEVKVLELKCLASKKVDEIDFVQNVSMVKSDNKLILEKEFKEIMSVSNGKLIKVILETALLTKEEIYWSTYIAAKSGIHMIKTSTGFASRGASLEDIQVIKEALNKYESESGIKLGIKASGGIKNSNDALAFVHAGSTRIGTSAGIEIVNGEVHFSSY